MNEFRLHHLVSELLSTFQIEGGENADSYVDLLRKNMTPYITTQVSAHTAKRSVANFSSRGDNFLKKYDELKAKQVRQLDPLVYLLSKISEDGSLCDFLRKRFEADVKEIKEIKVDSRTVLLPHEEQLKLPPSGAVMSTEELNKLKGQLESVTHSLNKKEAQKRTKSKLEGIPTLPEWTESRKYLSSDFAPTQPFSVQPIALISLPVAAQELAVVQDLLYLLNGIEGKYISVKPVSDRVTMRSFTMDRTMDVSLQSLVSRILPISSHFSTVCRFIDEYSKFEHGMVCQALCAAMRATMKEYHVLIADIEHQYHLSNMPLHKLWSSVQPCAKIMELLSSIAISVERVGCRGGAVLSLLHAKTCSLFGDQEAFPHSLSLTQAACAPYLEMTERWIYQGAVVDPYQEFMVVDDKQLRKDRMTAEYNDAYWDSRYTVKQDMIPSFLEKVAEKILYAGKYLNVIRECGMQLMYPNASELLYSPDERDYIDQIESAYSYASQKLIDLLVREQDIADRLMSLKHFFLLDQADFMVHFMDMADHELQKRIGDISLPRLESLMDLAIRSSTLSTSAYKDDISIKLIPYDLPTQLFHIMSIEPEVVGASPRRHYKPAPIVRPKEANLPGIRSLTLDYSVQWPVSLVINRKALVRYQLLFRNLLYCRHIERCLGRVWVNQKGSKQPMSEIRTTIAFSLRQRMLNFIQNYQHYMTFEAIEPNWCMMVDKIQSASTIDELLREHNDFIDRCLKDCMLTDLDVLRLISKIFTICAKFSTVMLHHYKAEFPDKPGTLPPDDAESKEIKKVVEASSVSLDATLASLDRQFTQKLVELLDYLSIVSAKDERYMANMIARLDYNGFYTTQLEETQFRRLSSASPR